MTIDGRDPPTLDEAGADLVEYLREFQAGGYPVGQVRRAVCAACGGTVFFLDADAVEGCARRLCVNCATPAFIGDSADYWDDADPERCACPCGGDTFTVAVGFAQREDGEVRWVSIGVRCERDGTLGVCADWKIDYSPTGHLLDRA